MTSISIASSRRGLAAVVLTLAVWPGHAAMAQDNAALKPRLVSITQVVEEIVHPVKIFKYEPPLALAPAPAGIAANSPEGVVSAWIASMRAGDPELALTFWDEASQKMIKERDRQTGKTREAWIEQWRRLYSADRKAQATAQVLFDAATLIEYQMLDASGKLVGGEPVVLRQVNGRWQLTLTYADHAAIQGWNSPTKRVTRLAPKR